LSAAIIDNPKIVMRSGEEGEEEEEKEEDRPQG
jgi:hypothetical protein